MSRSDSGEVVSAEKPAWELAWGLENPSLVDKQARDQLSEPRQWERSGFKYGYLAGVASGAPTDLTAEIDRLRAELANRDARLEALRQDPIQGIATELTRCIADLIRDLEEADKDLRDVRILDAWRRQDPQVLQWVVGSRFARVNVTLQRQGETLSVYYGDTEAEARKVAADALIAEPAIPCASCGLPWHHNGGNCGAVTVGSAVVTEASPRVNKYMCPHGFLELTACQECGT